MNFRTSIRILLCVLALASGFSHAQSEDLVGRWTVMSTGLTFIGGATVYIDLSIEKEDGEYRAYLYNGPAPIRVDGTSFEIDLDWFDAFHLDFSSTFSGQIAEDGTLVGKMLHHGADNFVGRPLRDGEFTGTRAVDPPDLDGLAPEPVDLAGIWNRASGKWFVRKLLPSFTERGREIFDSYLEMDNPNTRCASPGLALLNSSLPWPVEILNGDGYIVMAIGADYVRRIYLDGREFPDGATNSSLGFSTGEWKGETLVVTTTHLTPAFLTSKGQPLSADATIIEHLYFDDRGYLHADMWVDDPVNYTRRPYYPRVYDRDFTPRVITKVDCDPYTFFRALYLEGELEEFWSRAAFRR